MSHERNKNKTLSSYNVLDMTDEKGMFCSRLLADMGARVIRIEKPQQGLVKSSFYWATNVGKLDITLNIETEQGQEIFKKLVKSADVVVESYQPGYLESLGFSYSTLSQLNPQLIMASITGFGQFGPYKGYNSCDLVASAMGGQMYLCGEPQSPPLKPRGNYSYYSAGLFAAIGILLAMWNRHATGRGQYIDISLQECVAATLDHDMVRYFYEGVIAKREGSGHWNNAFQIFSCRDGYILLSLFQKWETLVEWLDAEGMAGDLTDKRWLDRGERLKHLGHIIDVLERWTKTHKVDELVKQGQLMHFPWAEVTSVPGLMNSTQLRERGFWVEVEHGSSGRKYKFPGAPARLDCSPWRVGDRLPNIAEHNREIYHRELELSEEEVETLAKEGVI